MDVNLSPRQQAILKVIVSEYVATGVPVGSATVLRRNDLRVSPATVRNEMAALEEAGCIAHPHTSAGRVPTELGYRYYIEWLMDESELSAPEKMKIRHQFHQVELDVNQWSQLAASVLARSVRNAALATRPHASAARLKQAHLISVHDRFVLVVLVFLEAEVKQQVFALDEPVSAADLTRLGNWLTAEGAGLTARELQEKLTHLPERDRWAGGLVVRMMQAADERGRDDLHLEGLRYILEQREFGDHEKALQVVEMLEDRATFTPLLSELLTNGGVQIVIGRENPQQGLRDLSLILARYGTPDDLIGAIGVVGPTRMAYDRIVPAVRYLAHILDDLVADLRS